MNAIHGNRLDSVLIYIGAILIVASLAAAWLLWPTRQASALPEWGVHADGNCASCHVHPDRFACPDCHEPPQANLACSRLEGCHAGATSPAEFCWDCHIEENGHVDALAKGGDERDGTVPFCTTCHGNTHGFPAGCQGCHSVATHNTHTGQASVFDTLAQIDLTACGACHPGKNPHGPQQIDCFVCHAAKHTPDAAATLQCATCHQLQPHDGLDCIDCHIGLDSIEDTSTQHNTEIRIPDCLLCHSAQAEHAGGAPCTSCHSAAVHNPTPAVPSPEFTGCFQCHPGQEAGGDCFRCHPRQGAHDFDRAQRPCSDCHNQEFHAGTVACAECHTLDHHDGKLVVTKDDCRDCHALALHPGAADCDTCHGANNNHKATPTVPGLDICLDCHPAQVEHAGGAPCTSCHTQAVHSAAPQTPAPEFTGCFQCHPGQEPGGNCFRCHPREGAHDFDRVQRPCGDCHNQNFHAGTVACAQCHFQDHHDGRLDVTRDDCRDCHALALHPGAADCDTCHGANNQHKTQPFIPGLGVCLNCHPAQVEHAGGAPCTSCHIDAVHSAAPQTPAPDFGGCFQCHPAQAGAGNCFECHPRQGAHDFDRVQRPCGDCHNQQFHAKVVECAACHTINHHDNKLVITRDDCRDCHALALHPQNDRCEDCHGDGNEHKAEPSIPGADSCLRCHPLARGNCLGRCHGSQVHESKPSVPFCTGCHAQRFHAGSVTCTRCHQVNDHHRESFSVRECQACHDQNYHAGSVACERCHLPVHGATAVPGEGGCFDCHRVAHADRDCLVCHTTLRVHHRITERALEIIRLPKRLATALERSLVAQIPDLRGVGPDKLPGPATEGATTDSLKRPLIERLPFTGLSSIDIVFPVVLILALIAVAMLILGARERTRREDDDEGPAT